jgi:hypothetical protein
VPFTLSAAMRVPEVIEVASAIVKLPCKKRMLLDLKPARHGER